jgi:hypothetical protein
MAGERWLVRIAGRRDGELFKMHSAGKWVWLQARDWMPQAAGERVRANIHRNGYLHVSLGIAGFAQDLMECSNTIRVRIR